MGFQRSSSKSGGGETAAALVLVALAALGFVWSTKKSPGAGPTPPPSPTPKPTAAGPDVSKLVRKEVFDGFPAFVVQYEGNVPHLYQDVKGLITTGVGNLVDPMDRALGLPWQREDGGLATQDEIRADWQRVKALAPAMVASKYNAPGALHLSQDAINQLVRRVLALNVAWIVKHHLPEFPDYPAPVQTAILSMAWGLGAGFFPQWPTFTAAVKRRDWKAAAENSHIKGVPEPRNKADRDLFLSAVGVS